MWGPACPALMGHGAASSAHLSVPGYVRTGTLEAFGREGLFLGEVEGRRRLLRCLGDDRASSSPFSPTMVGCKHTARVGLEVVGGEGCWAVELGGCPGTHGT